MKPSLFCRGAGLLRPMCGVRGTNGRGKTAPVRSVGAPVVGARGRRPATPLLAVALLTLVIPALAALTVETFHWSRTVEGVAGAHTIVAAPLDAAVFASVTDDFRDLRLLSDTNLEIPRAVEKLCTVRQRTVQHAVASKLITLRELPDNRIEAEFELTATNTVADGFSVATAQRDFQHNVKVEGSSEGATWTTLVAEAPLLDYTRYMDVRHLDVKLPANACRHFKLTISNVTAEQTQPFTHLMQQTGGRDGHLEQRSVDLRKQTFRVERVNFWRTELVEGAAEEARRDWPLPDFKVERDAKEHTTLVTIATGRLPLNRLTLELAENNFSRALELQVPAIRNGLEDWATAASGRLLSIALPGFSRRELALDFGELRVERVRLVLHDGDNPLLTVKAVTGSGPVWRALWLAEPGRSYRLLYGAEQLAAPNYDLDSVLAFVRRGLKPIAWQLGAVVENKSYQPTGAPLAWLNSSWLFGGAIALMLLVLGALLFRTVQTAAKDLDENKPGG